MTTKPMTKEKLILLLWEIKQGGEGGGGIEERGERRERERGKRKEKVQEDLVGK